MKLTLQRIMDAMPVIATIINERRPLPQKGKYRLARLHTKLTGEFEMASQHINEMIKAYDCPLTNTVTLADGTEETAPVPGGFRVPDDKMPEFNAARAAFLADEIEIEVEPVPLAYLDLGDAANGSIEAYELVQLGELVE